MSETHQPSILAVITIYNGKEMTADCLRSLAASTYRNLTPLIIDNASRDGSADYLAQNFPGLRIVRNETNLGVTRAYNQGIRRGLEDGYDFILIMNNDTLVEPDCFERLMARAAQPDGPEVLAPMMMYQSKPDVPWFCGGFVDYEAPTTGHCASLEEFNRLPQERRFITTCAFLMRAEVPRRIGFFDERIFMYCDDVDYSIRAARAGFRMEVVPDAILYHRVSASSGGTVGSPLQAYHLLRSGFHLWRKHLGWWGCHRKYCAHELGKWVLNLPEKWADEKQRPLAEAVMDAIWYHLSRQKDALSWPKSPAWFRRLMLRRPWFVAEVMALRFGSIVSAAAKG